MGLTFYCQYLLISRRLTSVELYDNLFQGCNKFVIINIKLSNQYTTVGGINHEQARR